QHAWRCRACRHGAGRAQAQWPRLRPTDENLPIYGKAHSGHRGRRGRPEPDGEEPGKPATEPVHHWRYEGWEAIMSYLNRENASFSSEVWDQIDAAAVGAAREILTGRRYLEVDGPYGVGLTAIEVGEEGYCRQPAPDEAGAVLSRACAIPMLRKGFGLSVRRIEGYESMGQPLDLRAVEDAAEAVARREEEFIYYGQPDFGIEGLLTAKGRNEVQCEDWNKIEQALNDVLRAVNHLDDKNFHGPYALALSP